MVHRQRTIHVLSGLALALALGFPAPARSSTDADLFFFTSSAAPNVLIFLDNSRSMKNIEWHPAFDPTADYSGLCGDWDNDTVYEIGTNPVETHCGNTRKIWSPENPTLWSGRYLNWYFSDAADPYYNAASGCSDPDTCIETATATPADCNTAAGGGTRFVDKYRRTRADAAKQVLLDAICLAEARGLKFGLAEFRQPEDVGLEDPNGGYVEVEIDHDKKTHSANIEAHIGNSDGSAATPLGEALFQLYTYFMSREAADLPVGQDGLTPFPKYQYDKGANGKFTAKPLPSPIEFACQKNFVILVTDGAPTRDDFDADPLATAAGFGSFDALIGDYNPDAEVEEPPLDPKEAAYFLDDIALYMVENDCRPDLDGKQWVDTYAIGFATDAAADALLDKTADVGNGLFFHAQDGDQLGEALLNALNDIIDKAPKSFTKVSVPSVRTSDGGDFFTSFFIPSGNRAFWEGHVTVWHLAGDGDILDKHGNCALEDPDPGECNSGPFKSDAVPFWDAASEVPDPADRELHTSKLVAGNPMRVAFDAALTAADLTVAPFAAPPDPAPNSALYPIKGSTALNEQGLADEVAAYARGCEFGTGVTSGDVGSPQACVAREQRLGDIFHSSPLVVGKPDSLIPEPSYLGFKVAYANRTRVLYAGANDGFLHAFHAGTWDAAAIPPAYTPGTGKELFAFMPWQSRRNIKRLPIDDPLSRQLYVDGGVNVADAWLYPTPTTASKAADGSEWRSVLVAGMRGGGSQYLALDVTDPDSAAAPVYLWEFPREDDPGADLPYMAQTWGKPILTRIRVRVGGNDNGGLGYERWVAIVTGGYAPSGDPNDSLNYAPAATAGRAIYVLDLKTGKVLAEAKFDPGASDDQQYMEYAIASTPGVLDLDFDGFSDLIYVGDLGGNLWKWVIHDIAEDRVNDGSGLRTQPSWTFRRIFQAPTVKISGTWYYKSFYFPPGATLLSGRLWLAFGSGERNDLPFLGVTGNDGENNRFYVMTDLDPYERSVVPLASSTEGDLQDATASPGGVVLTSRGYYFRVPDGEKFVTNVEIFAGLVVTASFVPLETPDPCTPQGTSNLYVFRVKNGEGHYEDGAGNPTRGIEIGPGMPSDPTISYGIGDADTRVYVGKSGADLESPEWDPDEEGYVRLLYWRELP